MHAGKPSMQEAVHMDRIQLFIFLLPHHQGNGVGFCQYTCRNLYHHPGRLYCGYLPGLFRRYQPFENIPVDENTSYLLAVGTTDPAGVPFSFDIKVVVPPANDCTPEVIASGGSASLTSTCCATNPGDPGSCPPGNQESTVWFEYQPSATTKAVEIAFANGTMSGVIAVEVFVGAPGQDCTGGLSPAPNVDPYCINAGSETFVVRCEDFSTTSIYVKVGSSEAGCGDFSLFYRQRRMRRCGCL